MARARSTCRLQYGRVRSDLARSGAVACDGRHTFRLAHRELEILHLPGDNAGSTTCGPTPFGMETGQANAQVRQVGHRRHFRWDSLWPALRAGPTILRAHENRTAISSRFLSASAEGRFSSVSVRRVARRTPVQRAPVGLPEGQGLARETSVCRGRSPVLDRTFLLHRWRADFILVSCPTVLDCLYMSCVAIQEHRDDNDGSCVDKCNWGHCEPLSLDSLSKERTRVSGDHAAVDSLDRAR